MEVFEGFWGCGGWEDGGLGEKVVNARHLRVNLNVYDWSTSLLTAWSTLLLR